VLLVDGAVTIEACRFESNHARARGGGLNDGGEGNTELWGEPFRVFTMSMSEFFETRYIKLAQTMSGIDRVAGAMMSVIKCHKAFNGMKILLDDFALTAKHACETLRSDPAIFEVWPAYVAAKELFEEYPLVIPDNIKDEEKSRLNEQFRVIKEGGELLARLANLRVPIPESVESFIEKCESYNTAWPN
ncbi:MAG: hypothetical protein R3318_07405, partial [Gammaproteobacteria bacterium]|nr:hypothetical protein [Gammaproteobacteria bacterium]